MVISIFRNQDVLAEDISIAFSREFFDDEFEDDRKLIYKLQDHVSDYMLIRLQNT